MKKIEAGYDFIDEETDEEIGEMLAWGKVTKKKLLQDIVRENKKLKNKVESLQMFLILSIFSLISLIFSMLKN